MIGTIIRELKPSAQNNRNSEGAFLKRKDGKLLFAYTRYGGEGAADHARADLYGILSENNGDSFGEPFALFTSASLGADNIMSVSLMRMQNGDLGLFYLQKHNDRLTCIPWLARSSDEGKTWYTHIRCIEEDGYFVLNNDRVIMLDNGRLLMPVSRHGRDDGKFLPGEVRIYASDDDGFTWKKLADGIQMSVPAGLHRENPAYLQNCMEPGVVQLQDGTVWCYIRTVLGRQYESFSKDNGETWSEPVPSPFTAPDSPMCVKKLKNGKFFAVWNPIPVYNGRSKTAHGIWTGGRSPLLFAVLNENGDFNLEHTVVEDDDSAGFCYCAIYETDNGDILLGYCAGGQEDGGCLNKLRIRKIPKADFAE